MYTYKKKRKIYYGIMIKWKWGYQCVDHKIVDLKAEGSPLLQGSDSTKYRILIIFQDGTSVCFLRLNELHNTKSKTPKIHTHTQSHRLYYAATAPVTKIALPNLRIRYSTK